MIKATSPAAKSSPIQTDAMSARETRTSALISNAVINPIIASMMIGTPQRMIATHAILNGRFTLPVKLSKSAIPDITRNVISLKVYCNNQFEIYTKRGSVRFKHCPFDYLNIYFDRNSNRDKYSLNCFCIKFALDVFNSIINLFQ